MNKLQVEDDMIFGENENISLLDDFEEDEFSDEEDLETEQQTKKGKKF